MRRGLLFVLPLGALLPLALLTLSPAPDPPPPSTSAPPLRAFDPYDSVRTDLSDYLWPTDASHAITSGFGEYRSNHFHAGIDISTNDRNGYPTFASRDGDIVRISVSATGYGKMLYVRHTDGYTTTYAHLQGFAPRVEDRVRAAQLKAECYPVEIICVPGELHVRKGDLIAFTGETGTGTSHLHFEIRDENMNAVNPFLCPAFRIEDTIPPSVKRFAVIPLGPGSTVDGNEEPGVFPPPPPGHASRIRVSVSGTVGFALQVRDRSNGIRYSHGLYRHGVLIDGKPLVDFRIDRISFLEPQQIALYYDQDLLLRGRGRFEKLFVDSPNTIPFLRMLPVGSGYIRTSSLAEGPHDFAILSEDYNGNISRVEGTLIVRPAPTWSMTTRGDTLIVATASPSAAVLLSSGRHTDETWKPAAMAPLSAAPDGSRRYLFAGSTAEIVRAEVRTDGGITSSPRYWVRVPAPAPGSLQLSGRLRGGMLEFQLHSGAIPDSMPQLVLREGSIERPVTLTTTGRGRYAGWILPIDSIGGLRRATANALFAGKRVDATADFDLFPIAPGRSGSYTFHDGNLRLEFDTLSVYSTLFVAPQPRSTGGDLVYEFEGEPAVLRDGLTLILRAGPARPGLGLFVERSGRWSLLDRAEPAADGTVRTRLRRRLDAVALMADTIPPSISRPRIRFPKTGVPMIDFRYGDNLAGVDYHELKTYIDGKFVIPDVDGEHHRASVTVPEPLTRGTHRLTIRLKDNLGNAGVTDHSFTVR